MNLPRGRRRIRTMSDDAGRERCPRPDLRNFPGRAPPDRPVGDRRRPSAAARGRPIRGHTTFEWLAGRQFLIQRSHYDHPDIPDAIAIIGVTGEQADGEHLSMHYFDSRGVYRVYAVSLDDGQWRFWREDPGSLGNASPARSAPTAAPSPARARCAATSWWGTGSWP